jgi:hypothetical protein
MSVAAESRTAKKDTGSFWDAFRPDSEHGLLALGAIGLFLITPPLGYFVSAWLFLLLPVGWALSLFAHLREPELSRQQRLIRTGQAVAVNGVALFIALFFTGFVADFLVGDKQHIEESVGAGFSTVHVLFGTGLLLSEARRD